MARAGAKRRQPARHHETDRRRHKDSGGQRFEDTLFFNRLRKQAKWVFVLLAIVFGVSFALFGVGSSVGAGLSDIFQGIRGNSSGQTSITKALKETEKNPKSPKAWSDLATAYDTKGDITAAISAWTTYTTLRPSNIDGLTQLANDLESQYATQTNEAQAAQVDTQTSQTTNFGPPPTSLLGRALANVADPIAQAASTSATTRFNQAMTARQDTGTKLIDAYRRIATLEPTDPNNQFLLADAATRFADAATAIVAYQRFLKLAPDDPKASTAKQEIKSLQSKLTSSPQG